MKKLWKITLLTALLAAGSSLTTLAANTITYVSVYFTEERQQPGTVWHVTAPAGSQGLYEVESYTWSQDPSIWTPGQSVTLTVLMRVADGYTFDKKLYASCSYGKAQRVTRNMSTRCTVRIQYTPKIQLEAPTDLYYEGEDSMLLHWSRVPYAAGYSVYITKDGCYLNEVKVAGRNNTELDLGPYATDSDSIYSAKVRAVGPDNRYDSILASEYTPLDEDIEEGSSSTASGRFFGSGEYRYFQDNDGNPASGWQLINNAWYYFDPQNANYAAANKWLLLGGCWYHFDKNGKMQIGWFKDTDGRWFLLNDGMSAKLPFGAMLSGWITTGPAGIWYYLYPDGHLAVSETTPDGFPVDATGKWIH